MHRSPTVSLLGVLTFETFSTWLGLPITTQTRPPHAKRNVTIMPAPSPASAVRRSILPATCLLLGAVIFLSGERALTNLAGLPSVGTLSAQTVANLVAAAFGVLFVLTIAMNFFSKDTPVTTEPIILHDLDEDLARALDELDHTPTTASRGKHAADIPTHTAGQTERLTDIITALRRAAALSADGKASAEAELERTRSDLDDTHAQLAHLSQVVEGHSAPVDVDALAAQIREEVQRDALASIQDLSESSDRLVTSLKDALARTEEQVTQTRAQAEEDRADLMAVHASEIAAVREQATAAEYERIKVAVLALNRTHANVLDPMQREAVERHQQRITDAFDALDAVNRNVVLPQVAMPRLSAPAPAPDANVNVDGAPDTDDTTAGAGDTDAGAGWLLRRRKRR